LAPVLSIKQRYEAARAAGRPILGGHRGNPGDHPENTMASFRSAVALGCDMVECDLHMSADGELVVIHDERVDRTTDGRGAVRATTVAELRELDAGAGERLPLLDELLDLVRDRVGFVIELKQGSLPYPGFDALLVERLRRWEMLDQTAGISFHHAWIGAMKKMEPRLPCGILEVVGSDPLQLLRDTGADLYSPHYSNSTPELVRRVHGAGAFFGVWTVDDEAGLEQCLRAGVDAIFTNRPRVIGPLLRAAR